MKRLIFAVLFAIAGVAAASETFVSTDGKIFSVREIRKVELVGTTFVITDAAGLSSYSYLKGDAVLFAKIVAKNPDWVQYNATTIYNPSVARYSACINTQSTFRWIGGGWTRISDNCGMYNAVLAKVN